MSCDSKLFDIAGKAFVNNDKCIDDFEDEQDLLEWLKSDDNNVIIQIYDKLLCFSRTRFNIYSGYPKDISVVNTKKRTFMTYMVVKLEDPIFTNPIVPIYVPYEIYELLFDYNYRFFNFTQKLYGTSTYMWNICAFTTYDFEYERTGIERELSE